MLPRQHIRHAGLDHRLAVPCGHLATRPFAHDSRASPQRFDHLLGLQFWNARATVFGFDRSCVLSCRTDGSIARTSVCSATANLNLAARSVNDRLGRWMDST